MLVSLNVFRIELSVSPIAFVQGQDHCNVVDAIRRRDADEAERFMRDHAWAAVESAGVFQPIATPDRRDNGSLAYGIMPWHSSRRSARRSPLQDFPLAPYGRNQKI